MLLLQADLFAIIKIIVLYSSTIWNPNVRFFLSSNEFFQQNLTDNNKTWLLHVFHVEDFEHYLLTPSSSTMVRDGGSLSIFGFSTGIKRGGYWTLISSTRKKNWKTILANDMIDNLFFRNTTVYNKRTIFRESTQRWKHYQFHQLRQNTHFLALSFT